MIIRTGARAQTGREQMGREPKVAGPAVTPDTDRAFRAVSREPMERECVLVSREVMARECSLGVMVRR
ncbi:hypothetical protein [Enterocloster lavalensis]|uniref:hypothetical protein n=1 Tax=Enterocloster lavalensis TaxID=460384 RepID=UPI002A814B29|nr:hypothetical protein [Enterocloster lavalensis]